MKSIGLILMLASLALSGCTTTGGGDEAIFGAQTGGTLTDGQIKQAGSSTVLPLAERWAEEFGFGRGVQVAVASGGSGAGASGICNKELDLGDMSRALKESEKEKCMANGVNPVEFKVAFDGLSVIVSQKNTFANDLTIEQLNHIFRAEDYATSWDQVDASFPAEEISLCFPDEDSGTYEYFNEEILGKNQHPRNDDAVQQSPDDNVLVNCLKDDANAIGYFGFAYLLENGDKVRALKVEGVEPTFDTIADGTYHPLSRPLYIVSNGAPTGLLADYFRYVYHPEGGQAIVEDVGYVPLDEATRAAMLAQIS